MSSVLYAVGPMECTGTGWPWILMPLCTDGLCSKYSHETMGRCRCRCSQMATQHHSTVAVSRARAMCRPWAVPIDGALSRARVVSRAGALFRAGTVSRPGALSRAGAVSRAWARGCYSGATQEAPPQLLSSAQSTTIGQRLVKSSAVLITEHCAPIMSGRLQL